MELELFAINPAECVSATHVASDARLKKRRVEIEIILYSAMYQMIGSGMRGGVCMINKRNAMANKPQVGKFDHEQPLRYLGDCDAKNLVGWASSQFLPISHFLGVGNE